MAGVGRIDLLERVGQRHPGQRRPRAVEAPDEEPGRPVTFPTWLKMSTPQAMASAILPAAHWAMTTLE